MNYSVWKSENGFEPSQYMGAPFFEVMILGILFYGALYLILKIFEVQLLAVDKVLRVFFPSSFVDEVQEFVMAFLCTAMFPPFLIYGLISNEKIGPGFAFGGITAWLGWILGITYFHPSFMLYVIVILATGCAYYVLFVYVLPRLFEFLIKNIRFQPILNFFNKKK